MQLALRGLLAAILSFGLLQADRRQTPTAESYVAEGARQQSSPFMVLVAHLGSREAGASSTTVLDAAAAHLNRTAWPYPVVAYIRSRSECRPAVRDRREQQRQD
ncbi:MAG: hypothetical protein V7647_540 [Acidobacteriota bacterium]|jgi:hypothetical protein